MTQSLQAAVQSFTPPLPLGIALSGGADSTALLLCCAEKWPAQVVALHINHGLQAAASKFEDHCRTLCRALGVPLRVRSVQAGHAPGQSPEDAARIARYQGLLELAAEADGPPLGAIALAQHADDQVETLLLALSRGAGLAGLSAMPQQWVRGEVAFFRPLLQVRGSEIRNWLDGRAQHYVTDPSNADERYTRNRIRAQLLPVLDHVFPQFRDTFARSAAHAAQAQGLLDELAQQDLQLALRASDGALLLQGVQQLSTARQANLLRHWLKSRYRVIPSTAQLDELLRQVAAARTRGQKIHIKVGDGFAVRRGAVLAWYNPQDLLPKN
jgi:tRNA(Ile)-lysidine synthase